jgi:hypothetical protein
MKLCQLSLSMCCIVLLTAVYSEPTACYFDKKEAAPVNYRSGLYVVKDTVKTLTVISIWHTTCTKGNFLNRQ